MTFGDTSARWAKRAAMAVRLNCVPDAHKTTLISDSEEAAAARVWEPKRTSDTIL